MIDFFECKSQVEESTKNIIKKIEQADSDYLKSNIQDCAKNIETALLYSEKQLLYIREMFYSLYEQNSIQSKYFNRIAAVGLEIEVCKVSKESTYKITMPFLLPNQRSRWQGFKDTICHSLYTTLNDYCSKSQVTPFKDCAVIFVSYINEKDKRFTADNDNKEAKDVLNILAKTFITDDNGLLCDILYVTKLTSHRSKTNIYITNKSNLANLYTTILTENI